MIPTTQIDDAGALDKLEGFASLNGPAFYRMASNDATITPTKGAPLEILAQIGTGDGPVVVFDPGSDVLWHMSAR